MVTDAGWSEVSMMPEAFEHGGKTVGLLTVLGFLVSAVLSVVQ